jgi:beta-glucanase (GH16 family)
VHAGLAAEWSLVPSMSTKAYYNDNLLLTPLPHDSTYGYWISPAVEFSGKTERLEVSGKAALDFVDYYGGENQTDSRMCFFR